MMLGEYSRCYRILRSFLPPFGGPTNFGAGLTIADQSVGLNELGVMAMLLGRLHEAVAVRREDDARKRALNAPTRTSIGLQNTWDVNFYLGRLQDALAIAEEAWCEAERTDEEERANQLLNSLICRALTQHSLGNIASARQDFATATGLDSDGRLFSFFQRLQHARHHLDLGELTACRTLVDTNSSRGSGWERAGCQALLARIALAEGRDPSKHIIKIRAWTARTGDMEWILEAHSLAAKSALACGDLPSARAEADDGLRQARLCDYRLRKIELLVTLSAINLAWPDANRALATAREGLDLATARECNYAWGEADASHAWGLAFEALGQREQAQRAFHQALAVRERIEHPQANITRDALARLEVGT